MNKVDRQFQVKTKLITNLSVASGRIKRHIKTARPNRFMKFINTRIILASSIFFYIASLAMMGS
jgi:hypothetical protein